MGATGELLLWREEAGRRRIGGPGLSRAPLGGIWEEVALHRISQLHRVSFQNKTARTKGRPSQAVISAGAFGFQSDRRERGVVTLGADDLERNGKNASRGVVLHTACHHNCSLPAALHPTFGSHIHPPNPAHGGPARLGSTSSCSLICDSRVPSVASVFNSPPIPSSRSLRSTPREERMSSSRSDNFKACCLPRPIETQSAKRD